MTQCDAEHWKPAFGLSILGCVLDHGHEGPHRDQRGNEWYGLGQMTAHMGGEE